VASFSSGELVDHYTYGIGLTSLVAANGTAGYYDFGLTGNTVGITNAAGNYMNRYSYLPFGQTTTIAAAVANPFTFVGQAGVMSVAAGLTHMGARNYDSLTGQFVSSDPINLLGGDPKLAVSNLKCN